MKQRFHTGTILFRQHHRMQSSFFRNQYMPGLAERIKARVPSIKNKSIYRKFHLDLHQMNKNHGVLPAAYQVHRGDKNIDRSINKFNRKSRLQSNRNRRQIESKFKDPSFHHSNHVEINKKIKSLQKIEFDINSLLGKYEANLGTFVQYTEKFTKNNHSYGCDASHLMKTEEIYRSLCMKLRQAIVGYSRYHNLSWRKSQNNDQCPYNKSAKFLELLENMRLRRSHLIDASRKNLINKKSAVEESSFFKWVSDKINGESFFENDDQYLEQLTAHISPDCTANLRIYDAVLKSYRPGQISEIETILKLMNTSFRQGNPNVQPDRQIYHRLMKIYKGSGSLGDAQKSMNLLHEMLRTTHTEIEEGSALSCQPTPQTYKIVISCFHGIGNNLDTKTNAISLAENVLNIMENENEFIYEKRASSTSQEEHKCDPYSAFLLNLISAGPKGIQCYSSRVDRLVERMIGKDEYKKLLTDDETLIDTTAITEIFVHDLIYAFSIVGNRSDLNKSKILLKKMENTRNAALADKSSSILWDTKYPRSNSFNTIITGLLHSTFATDSGLVESDARNVSSPSTLHDAMFATGLIDSILRRGVSKTDIYSYYRLIRLWGATNAREAGRRGEEILARLEIFMAINGERKSLIDISLRSKQVALECWSVSAGAGEPGAARSALKLLNRFDERITAETKNFEEERRERRFFFIAVIRACAATCVEADKPEALQISFEMYNRMVENDVSPTAYTFVQLLKCCQLVGPSAQDQALKLSKQVFQSACMLGVVNKHVLFLLKQVNFQLFEAYEKKQEHSINVRKTSVDE